MHRKLIRRYLPHHETFREHRHLSWLGSLLHDPNLWHLNRRSVSGAVAVGLFCAFVPIPFQMILAALISILARVNLPISVVVVWVTNPLTMGPIFFFAYKVGTAILGTPIHPGAAETRGLEWAWRELQVIWKPLLLGSLLCGAVSALLGFVGIRLSWRLHLVRRLNARRERREALRRRDRDA
ncbi:MAG: DUF2062 domain-containing protein [Gammaproteobacteria bacterium]|nr:DUF2062 domain-containing protein [Gammaproteobacteria bacterium]